MASLLPTITPVVPVVPITPGPPLTVTGSGMSTPFSRMHAAKSLNAASAAAVSTGIASTGIAPPAGAPGGSEASAAEAPTVRAISAAPASTANARRERLDPTGSATSTAAGVQVIVGGAAGWDGVAWVSIVSWSIGCSLGGSAPLRRGWPAVRGACVRYRGEA